MKRRIAIISEHASPLGMLGGADSGGQNVYVGQVARHLAAAGHEVDVFTRRDGEDLPGTVDWLGGTRIVHVPAGPPRPIPKEELLPFMAEFESSLGGMIRSEGKGYDIVHGNFWMSGLVAAGLRRTFGIPFVMTFHALGRVRRLHQKSDDRFPDARFEIEDRLMAEADAIIAECPQDREDMERLYGAPPSRITVIPCGFDPREFSPMPRTIARLVLGLDPRKRLVLQLGRLVPRKGIDNAIRAIARLRAAHGMEAALLIVGGESERPDPARTPEIGRLAGVARAEGVEDLVQFIGHRGRDVLKYWYAAADVFVTTPWYEPFGITPVEAMACARPVIGSRVGGIRSTVVDGRTGYLVPPNDPEALAGRLARVLGDPDIRDEMGRRGQERAEALYTWARVTDSIAGIYEDVLAPAEVSR